MLGEGTAEGLDLAELIVLFNVLLPVILAVLLFVFRLGFNSLGVVDMGLEAVVVFHLTQKAHGFWEERVCVDENDTNLFNESSLVDGVENDNVASDQGDGEKWSLFSLDGFLQT